MGIIKNSRIQKRKIVGIALLGLMALSSCTKSIPYETLPAETKEKDVAKSLIDTSSEYLYSSSQQSASRSAADAFPFLAGDNKRVKLEITKDALRIIEVERDQRFASNTLNNKLVLEIPVDHVQYECRKDRFGECTNSEEETSKIPWDQRNTLRVKLENVKSAELELLPILSSSTFGENCYENVSSRLLKSEIEKDAINFQIERTFKTRLECLSDDAQNLSDATISAVYHYSLVKTSSILSKDYKTVSYPDGSVDEQSFGFFTSKKHKLDVDNNNTDKSTIQIMNRWNPNRKEIVYHLSDEFAKPENKMIKELTEKTVDTLNKGLEQAQVNFRINLKDPSGKVPGDIRNSMIVLVEDPVASSVIGYGPQTEDPVTGEIVSARTVMFLGTIKKFVKYTYDEIQREKKAQALEAKSNTQVATFKLAPSLQQQVSALKSTGKVFGATALVEQVMNKISGQKSGSEKEEKAGSVEKKQDSGLQIGKPTVSADKITSFVRNYTARKNEEFSGRDLKSKIKYLNEAKNCAFAPAMEGVSAGLSKKLLAQFPDDMKPWTALSDEEKEKALAIILPEIWIPTLIHEIGHNLGLRHNFAASEDKDNFYSDEELANNKIGHRIPFSSVMDYGNDLKTLPMLGKYDIAALKFGYLRKVSVVSGDQVALVDVPNTLEDLLPKLEAEGKSLKDYQYCTDENTGINAGCKRFDLGTSYTEIVQNMITDYEEAYSRRNFRDGRASFSSMDDLAYLSRVSGMFRELRVMMEVAERIKYRFNVDYDNQVWEDVPFARDLKHASLLAGSFLANVLLVPDVTCAVAAKRDPKTIIGVIELNRISSDSMSCFDAKAQADLEARLQQGKNLMFVGQAGKALNSKKDPNSRNSYADQIDVRGIWLDKVAAIRTLTARQIEISTMNDHTDSFLNIQDLRQGVLDVLTGLMSNNVVNAVEFTMLDGSKSKFEINYDMGDSQLIQSPLLVDVINRSGMSEESKQRLISRLGVNREGTTPLKKIIAKTVAQNAVDPNRVHLDDESLRDALTVYKFNAVENPKLSKTAREIQIGKMTYVADVNNIFAREAVELLPAVSMMDKLDQEKLAKVLELKKKKETLPPPADQTDAAKAEHALMKDIYNKVSAEKMEDYLNGIIKNAPFYVEQLQILPSAN